MRMLWLPDALRDAGLNVKVLPGWETRGRAFSRTPSGFVWHDTVTTDGWSIRRVEELLRDGRPGVPGPLAQLGGPRDGSITVISAGRANHNGYGRWGNLAVALEVYCAGGLKGHEEPYNGAQAETAAVAASVILPRLGHGADRGEGHREQDPRRKIDPYGISCPELRRRTRVLLSQPITPNSQEYDVMATKEELRDVFREVLAEHDGLFIASDGRKQYLVDQADRKLFHIRTGSLFQKALAKYPNVGQTLDPEEIDGGLWEVEA